MEEKLRTMATLKLTATVIVLNAWCKGKSEKQGVFWQKSQC